MYLMSPLFCEKGGDTIQGRTLFKEIRYLWKYDNDNRACHFLRKLFSVPVLIEQVLIF